MNDNGPHTVDARKMARKTRRQQQQQRSARGRQPEGFDPGQLRQPDPETPPALYNRLFKGDENNNEDWREISPDVSAGNFDRSELRVLREKQRAVSVLRDLESRYNISLETKIDELVSQIAFQGQSSKGRNMALVRSMNRQEQVQRSEQMHDMAGGRSSGGYGIMDKLKNMTKGVEIGPPQGGDQLAAPGRSDFGVGFDDGRRRNDMW